MCNHLLPWELQNYNSLLKNRQQENVGSLQEKIPDVQGQTRSPNKMVGGEKLYLKSNPIPARDAQGAQTKTCAHQDSEAPQRLSRPAFECLSVFCGGMGQQWPASGTGATGTADLGHIVCGISPLGGNLTTESPSRWPTNGRIIILSKLTVWIITNWEALKEMGIPDRLTYLPRNLYVNQKATVRALCGTTDWCRIEKGVQQGCLLSPFA